MISGNGFIPKWYKEKCKDRIGNRKHASGYWFDFIFPRCIVPHIKLYRWLNFYFKIGGKQ